MMDVAERYLGELVQRCMVQTKAPEMPSILNSFISCRLHDLMRDLSVRKAEEENFLLSKSYDEIANNSSLPHLQLYRLVIRLSGERVSNYVPLERRTMRHLRSLALISPYSYDRRKLQAMKPQFNQFKMLRLLVIKGVAYLKPSKAIHLRYLSLIYSFSPCLPSSIGNLHHLETLDLRDTIMSRIPNVLWKLKQLKHLCLPEDYDIPKLGKLVDRFLRLDGLNKLEILENFSSPPCHIKDISKLKNLVALSAKINVEFGDPKGIIGYMSNSEHLRPTSLKLYSSGSDVTNEKLSTAVAQCFSCGNLQKLKVFCPIGNLPKYEANFCPALIELELEGSLITEDPMKTLEMLRNLRSLGLSSFSFVGKEMRCTGLGFRQLRNLSLLWLPYLEKWWVDDGAMPNLSSLTICEKLEMLPVGLRSVTTLQELRIHGMPREFTERIEVVDGREGADFHKISHIPSIIIN